VTSNSFILNVYELDLTPMGEQLVSLPIRIGRSSLNDVCVAHRLVSEFHARIEEIGDRICVRDLNSKNGVLVEAIGSAGAARIAAQTPIDLEPYGFEFLLSPLLRVRVRPASGNGEARQRHSQALGSVLGNGTLSANGAPYSENPPTEGFGVRGAIAPEVVRPAAAPRLSPPIAAAARPITSPPPPGHSPPTAISSAGRSPAPPAVAPQRALAPLDGAEARNARAVPRGVPRPGSGTHVGHSASPHSASPAVQPYASVLIEPPPGSLALPPLPGTLAVAPPLAHDAPAPDTRPSRPSPARDATQPRAAEPIVPPLAQTAWEMGPGTLPAAAVQPTPTPEAPSRSLETIALRGLRELAASLVPGQPVESASDVVQLVTKLHDAIEMFCRCFIPVREACSRFISSDDLERAAAERCQNRSGSYLAIERALEPRAVAAALLDWRNDDQDAPRAVEHILADLMLHHLALAQAALEGTKTLLDELSPRRIEDRHPASPSMLTRLGLVGARERELWETYLARHADVASAGRAFREIFGETFTRAYAIHYPPPGSGPSL
jgi:hypothetical protein